MHQNYRFHERGYRGDTKLPETGVGDDRWQNIIVFRTAMKHIYYKKLLLYYNKKKLYVL